LSFYYGLKEPDIKPTLVGRLNRVLKVFLDGSYYKLILQERNKSATLYSN